MKWLYNIQNKKVWQKDGTTGIQAILLRPVWKEEDNTYTSAIVDLKVTSTKYLMRSLAQKEFDEKEKAFINKIIQKTSIKDYYIDESDLANDEKSIYLNRAEIYVHENFNIKQLLNWVKIYFAINGYPCDEFEETEFETFAFDVNPILRIFSVDNVKRFEDKFGHEWWKNKYKHKSDKALINKLLKNISDN